MFRRIRIICWLVLLLAALAALLVPMLLGSEPVREELRRQAALRLGQEIGLESVELAWLPFPHLLVKGISLEHPRWRVELGEIHFHPRWRALARRQLQIRQVILEYPVFHFDPAGLELGLRELVLPTELPAGGEFLIRRGQIFIGSQSGLLGLETPPLAVVQIDGRIDLTPARLDLSLNGRPDFGAKLELNGWYRPDGSHQLNLDGRGLKLHRMVSSLADGRVATLETLANLQLAISGNNLEDLTATLHGDLPCLLLEPDSERVRLDCGVAHLELNRRGRDLELLIHQLEIKEPELQLAGRISRHFGDQPPDPAAEEAAGLNAAQPTDPPPGQPSGQAEPSLPVSDHGVEPLADGHGVPYWEIDLAGRDLNAGEIRDVVLAMLGRFEAAREFHAIVLDGRARSAAFHFAGPESDLKDFRTMVVGVEVDWAEIMVPEIDLHLPWARGSLRIADGILRLREAEARLGDSRGRDGSLDTGLFADIKTLRLDLELDADLGDLQRVLPEIIDDPVFQAEVHKFSHPQGRAHGRLRIGERRDDFQVAVEIAGIAGRAANQHLPWPLEITQGQATITYQVTANEKKLGSDTNFPHQSRRQVHWREVAGRIGPHLIEESSGRTLIDPAIPFNLKSLRGEVDAAALLAHLNDYPRLAPLLAGVVTEADGRVAVESARAQGEIVQPRHWQYRLELRPRDLSWYSPLLATVITNPDGRLLLEQNRVQLVELATRLERDHFLLNGSFEHQLLQSWQGALRLTGDYGQATAAWLEQRNWLSAGLMPRPPLLVESLVLHGEQTANGLTSLSGLLKTPPTEPVAASLRFQVEGLDGGLDWAAGIRANAALDGDGQANLLLRLALPATGGEVNRHGAPDLDLVFQGELDGAALQRFLSQLPFSLEWMQGEAELGLRQAEAAPRFTGRLALRRLTADPAAFPLLPPITALNVRGENRELRLANLELALNHDEQAKLSGIIRPDPAGGSLLDLELAAPLLRRSTLQHWRQKWSQSHLLDSKAGYYHWPLSGRVGLNLQRLISDLVSDHGAPHLAAIEPAHVLKYASPSGLPLLSNPRAAPRDRLLQNEPRDRLRDLPPDTAGQPELVFEPFRGGLELHPDGGISVAIAHSVLCCLELTGNWHSEPRLGSNHFLISSACPEDSRFENILPCFGIHQDVLIGDCLVDAELQGDPDHWQQGRINIRSPAGGRILRLKLLSRIFSVVNLTDIFSGGIAGLDERGFAYQSLDLEAAIDNNLLRLERAVVRGEGLNLFVRGEVDLGNYQADLVVLIAPFKTIDTIIGRVPFIGRLLGGRDAAVITIPVAVRGDLREPDIVVLAPEAVGEGMLNLIRSTLMLPFNIISPILPRSNDSSSHDSPSP